MTFVQYFLGSKSIFYFFTFTTSKQSQLMQFLNGYEVYHNAGLFKETALQKQS